MITINAKPGQQIELGHRGENLARRVVFDIKNWIAEFGATGTVVLVAHRPQDEYPYVAECIHQADKVFWPITEVETLVPSTPGSVELRYKIGDTVVKSMVWKTHVVAALGEPTGRPDIDEDGSSYATGLDGAPGKDGVTFTPHVDADGNLSWTNDGGLPNPPTVNIMGPKGDGEGMEKENVNFTEFGGLDFRDGAVANALTEATNIDLVKLPMAIAPRTSRDILSITGPEGSVYHNSILYTVTAGEMFNESGDRACTLPSGAGYQRSFVNFGTTLLILPDKAAYYQNGNLLRLAQLPDAAAYIAAQGRIMCCNDDTIYVSARGDCGTWTPDGSNEGAWQKIVGTRGKFTGAAVLNGVPYFFKPDNVTKLYGSGFDDYEPASTPIPGVKSGCEKSVVVCHDVIYYYNENGVMTYDGHVSKLVSEPLGGIAKHHENVVAGTDGRSYWVQFNGRGIYRFDGKNWMFEAAPELQEFVPTPTGLLYRDTTGALVSVGGGSYGDAGTREATYSYSAQLGPMLCRDYGETGISKICLRMALGPENISTGTPTFNFSYRLDAGDWHTTTVSPASGNSVIEIATVTDAFHELTMKFEGTTTASGRWSCTGIWLEPNEEA